VIESKDRLTRILHKWKTGGTAYRLLGRASYTPMMILEKAVTDNMGAATWSEMERWCTDTRKTSSQDLVREALLGAIKMNGGVE